MLTLRSPWVAPTVLGALALVVRLLHLDHPPITDELYHFFAAQSWLAEGQLRIADGVYDRTALFTQFLAQWIRLFGDSVVVIRLPSVIAGTLLVVLVFLWTRNVAGSLAAVFAGLLLALDPEAVEISQFARFYAFHSLLFWLGAVAIYRLVMAPPASWGHTTLLAIGCVLCFYAAYYLQATTLIGLIGVAAWAVVAFGLRWRAIFPPARWGVAAAVVLLCAAALWLAVESSIPAYLLERYRTPTPYLVAIKDAFWYYHQALTIYYPTFWPLTVLAVVIGIAYRPGPTVFCASVAGVALVLHSFAGAKAMRYISYVWPFLFVLWGVALAEIWPWLRRFLEGIGTRTLTWMRLGRLGRPGTYAVLVVALLFAVAANGAIVRTTATMLGIYIPPLERPADWAAAKEPLAPLVADADIVLTTSELETLYYLGRYDILISKGRLSEVGQRREFDRDPRTGRPVIASPESLALLMDCYPNGLIVTSAERWRDPTQLDDAVADLIVARAQEVELSASGMQAYLWQQPDATRRAEACGRLPAAIGTAAMTGTERGDAS